MRRPRRPARLRARAKARAARAGRGAARATRGSSSALRRGRRARRAAHLARRCAPRGRHRALGRGSAGQSAHCNRSRAGRSRERRGSRARRRRGGGRRPARHVLDNAIKFAPSGSITVRARGEDEHAVLEVDDEGRGVPEELRSSLFLPFRRSSPGVPGHGIGLALVAHVARVHGGDAAFVPRAGGARVRIRLPRAR
ncbi:MAG: HAMP domain-containing histidine kinase [Sandaracinaceae bacterium]|nr:HAMP domain-containing histidine kinase [Sandaracinaceae bacterium]